MKDSGVEWMGEIPEHWRTSKIRNLCYMQSGKNLTSEEIESKGLFPVYGGNGIRGYYPTFNRDGNYILIGRQGALCGNINLVRGRFWATEHAIVVDSKEHFIDVTYFSYLLRSMNLNQYSQTAAQPGLAVGQIGNLKTILPSISEQQIIATFLDDKTSQIDGILSDTKQSIAEFKVYKQAIITETVTKGLNPDVKMKGSEIEWIGEIPEHWDVNTAKRVFRKEKRPIINDEIVTAFRDGEVTQRRNRRTDGFTMADKEIGYQGVNPGDLVIHAMDAFAGAIGVSDSSGKCSPVCSICTPIIEANPYYYAYLLRIYSILGYIESMAKGIRERSTDFRYATFAITPLVQPPIHEQQQIVDFLDEKITHIDALIADKEKMVQELEDYKKALIYEYVTGKKEV